MNGLPYYKRFPRDFIEGTIGMPFEVKCAYAFLLDLIYMQGGKLPDDPRYISGLMGCSVRKWKSIRNDLLEAGKIQVGGGSISNYRAIKELESLRKVQDKMRENGRRSNKNNNLQKPSLNHTEPEPDIEKDKSFSLETPPQALAAGERYAARQRARNLDSHEGSSNVVSLPGKLERSSGGEG